jgi:DNA polymerase III delta subunit
MSLVYFVSGNDVWLRNRFVREFIAQKESQGFRLESHDGAQITESDFRTILGGGVFFSEGTLVWITNPTKVDPSLIKVQLGKNANPSVVILLEHHGTLKKATGLSVEVVTKLPKECKRDFSEPPWYKKKDHAIEIAGKIAKGEGIKIEPKLLKALVDHTGTDLGILYFELKKVGMITKGREVTAGDLRQTLAPLSEVSGSIICDAIALRSKAHFLKAVDRYLKVNKGEVFQLCNQFLQPTFLKWLACADLLEKGVSLNQIAKEMGVNDYYLKNTLLPPAKRWGREGCLMLVCAVSRAQEATLKGSRYSFFHLMGKFLEAFDLKK